MSYRTSQDGMYQRGHQKQASSFGGGDSWGQAKPLSLEDTLKLHLKFVSIKILSAACAARAMVDGGGVVRNV
jgi:hypothetical protein